MRSLAAFALVLALSGCGGGSDPAPSEAAAPAADVDTQIEAAVRKHLARRSDLDMSAMELTIERVNVQGETADATVGFQVKDQPEAAMSMDYHLVKTAGEWVVEPPAPPPSAAPVPTPAPQGLPPGHPPTSGTAPAQPLPPGHPPVAQ